LPGQSGVGAPLPNPTGQSVDGQGWPVAFDVLPGNTADVAALSLTIARFRERFRIRRAVVVADRGMLGQATLAQLRDHVTAPFDYILGGPLRRERTVAEEVLGRPGRYQQVADNLEVEEVRLGERRYIVCRNPIEAKQDAADRAALLTKLRQTLPRRHPLSPPRTDCLGHAATACQAAGVAIPTAVTALGPTPDLEPPPADPAALQV